MPPTVLVREPATGACWDAYTHSYPWFKILVRDVSKILHIGNPMDLKFCFRSFSCLFQDAVKFDRYNLAFKKGVLKACQVIMFFQIKTIIILLRIHIIYNFI